MARKITFISAMALALSTAGCWVSPESEVELPPAAHAAALGDEESDPTQYEAPTEAARQIEALMRRLRALDGESPGAPSDSEADATGEYRLAISKALDVQLRASLEAHALNNVDAALAPLDEVGSLLASPEAKALGEAVLTELPDSIALIREAILGTARITAVQGWKYDEGDEFDPPPPGGEDHCFADPPACRYDGLGPEMCHGAGAPELAGLEELNKCKWLIDDSYPYTFKSGFYENNAWSASRVKVKDGELVLSSRLNQAAKMCPWGGTYAGGGRCLIFDKIVPTGSYQTFLYAATQVKILLTQGVNGGCPADTMPYPYFPGLCVVTATFNLPWQTPIEIVDVKSGPTHRWIRYYTKAFDCGRHLGPNSPQASTDCPFISAGLLSREYSTALGWPADQMQVKGLRSRYGRFQVRGVLPEVPGGFPAYWIFAQNNHDFTPADGFGTNEIDLMEQTHGILNSGQDLKRSFTATLQHSSSSSVSEMFRTATRVDMSNTLYPLVSAHPGLSAASSLTQDMHIYAVEHDPTHLRFYFDNQLIREYEVPAPAAPMQVTSTEPQTAPTCTMHLPNLDPQVSEQDYFWFLNTGIDYRENWPADGAPTPNGFAEQSPNRIDYVRHYNPCTAGADFCPAGSTWNGSDCLVSILPVGMFPGAYIGGDGDVYYPGSPKPSNHCGTSQATWLDPLCRIHGHTDGAQHGYLRDGAYYLESSCLESTLSPSCTQPCRGLGIFDGYHCRIDGPESGRVYEDLAGTLAYPVASNVPCAPGDQWLDLGGFYLCLVNVLPGRSYFVYDSALYANPTCSTTEGLANCGKPCDEHTTWGRIAGHQFGCKVAQPPLAFQPFYLVDNLGVARFYYQRQSNVPALACPWQPPASSGLIAEFDTQNCVFRTAPGHDFTSHQTAGLSSSILWLASHCEASPDWQFPFQNQAEGSASAEASCAH